MPASGAAFPESPLLLEVFQVHRLHRLLLLLSKERVAKSLYGYDHLCFISIDYGSLGNIRRWCFRTGLFLV